MPFYQYKAVTNEGVEVKGVVEAMDFDDVYHATETSGLYILDIRRTHAYAAPLLDRFHARRVKRKDMIEFSNNLAVMIKAGIPLLTALSDIAETTENEYFQKKIETIRNTISLGASLGDAVRMHAVIFPDIFIRLVSVGEETGNLEGSLRDVAGHLRRVEDLVSAIKRALVYPIFAFTSAMGAMIFWLVYVLPKILSLFQDMQVAIPGVTRFLIVASHFTQKFWPILMLLPFIFYGMIKLMKRNSKAAYYIDLAKLKIPIMKLIVENKILGLFTEQMRILIRSGLTIDRSLELVSEIVGNAVYMNAITRAREEVLAGSAISDALKKQRLFSPLLLRMTHVGETSGTLEEQYTFLSEFYIKKLDDISERLGKMLEPIIIIVLGIMFAVIIIGLLLPVYDLISKMGKV
ncbi:MAG: hypothetical protein CO150_06320 [Nitrospirae bacterium CG_4_9_14_3_um_filter_53_35]|nr:MAG: hypothetical protein AUK29_02845 [Nitrospirae bacterium CG2_30_53_67]PIS36562.1 MAG: hypothetical protein COT35_10455 [Nitrospirae bacterium CG08_land_8_20_14_0_20_52_24]PIV85519.1 MAG: hypothetical protein COW52_01800 [Nitrospirae bacterium CG17_big_fil_post_rev_8_21_14_2_50_50_9]PIW85185.1 MAG: hypothetical protein COZ95_05870 [Nitrospirae bacterium CG_4_8_14_3_um_filter_50_41]PIX84538.1 MAG: hypothetical protein COZ32_13065 [Nitrospirae bacterium CG_4_10_14_3_um_filter_53_41]PJA7457